MSEKKTKQKVIKDKVIKNKGKTIKSKTKVKNNDIIIQPDNTPSKGNLLSNNDDVIKIEQGSVVGIKDNEIKNTKSPDTDTFTSNILNHFFIASSERLST